MKRRFLVAVGAAVLLMSALAASPASALTSIGASLTCDHDNHCVNGTATSANAAVQMTAVGVAVDPAAAVCHGGGTGATLIEITCSIGGKSETMSFPGSKGAVPITTSGQTMSRLPVCWVVTGYFPTVLGPQHVVSTDGCALLAV